MRKYSRWECRLIRAARTINRNSGWPKLPPPDRFITRRERSKAIPDVRRVDSTRSYVTYGAAQYNTCNILKECEKSKMASVPPPQVTINYVNSRLRNIA